MLKMGRGCCGSRSRGILKTFGICDNAVKVIDAAKGLKPGKGVSILTCDLFVETNPVFEWQSFPESPLILLQLALGFGHVGVYGFQVPLDSFPRNIKNLRRLYAKWRNSDCTVA